MLFPQRRQEERRRRRAQQQELQVAESLGKHPLHNRYVVLAVGSIPAPDGCLEWGPA